MSDKSMFQPDEKEIAGFRARFEELPRIISSWVDAHIDLAKSDVLDFGCGEGVTALGMIKNRGAATVTGVDIMPDVHRCLERARQHLGVEELPGTLMLSQIAPGSDFNSGKMYDLIYSWSVFEHIEQPRIKDTLRLLRTKLKEHGLLFIQIAPLFYSAEGSHLSHRIPVRWGHLALQESVYFRKLCEACESREEIDALWSCYQWLNRMTVPELKRILVETGFEIVREYVTIDEADVPAALLEIYSRDVLVTNQVVLLARPAKEKFKTGGWFR